METLAIPKAIVDITPDWLTRSLRVAGYLGGEQVTSADATSVGEGKGMLSQIVRLHLTYDAPSVSAPSNLIAKLPTLARENRELAAAYGLYERELHFYRDLRFRVSFRSPECFYACSEAESGDFVLLLEDLSEGTQLDQIDGCSLAKAEDVITQLARLHAAWWLHPDLETLTWVPDGTAPEVLAGAANLFRAAWPRYLARVGDGCPEMVRQAGDRLAGRFEDIQLRLMSGAITLIHGDLRLDNLFFDLPDASTAAVDWQVLRRGRGMLDTSYFLSTSLQTDLRRQHERSLLQRYHDELLQCGVQGYSVDDCIDDHRRALLDGLLGVAAASTLDTANERGAAWFQTMHERCCAANLDWQTHTLLQ